MKRLALSAALLVACEATPPPVVKAPEPVVVAKAPAPSPKVEDPAAAADELVQRTLEEVSKIRGLPVKHRVKSVTLDRAAMIARIKKKALEEIPADVLAAEGEVLVALGLVPADYDLLAGTMDLLEGQIAGFYEPATRTMYLAEDLSESEAKETLAHELVHALQDQSWDIDRFLKFELGKSDRGGAAHAVIEGDATSAMIDATSGRDAALSIPPSVLKTTMLVGLRLTPSGAKAPAVIAESLMAPYADGFGFIDERRRAGGWKAVDAAYEDLPATTEQLLHPAKYAAHEPALDVSKIAPGPLGAGFTARLDDDLGEQGLRMMLQEWGSRDAGARAATGWGGDRILLAERRDGDARTFAAAYHVRYDTPKDADAATKLLKAKFKACVARPDRGPFVWERKGADVVLVGGPYTRAGGALRPAGSCADATRWAKSILKP